MEEKLEELQAACVQANDILNLLESSTDEFKKEGAIALIDTKLLGAKFGAVVLAIQSIQGSGEKKRRKRSPNKTLIADPRQTEISGTTAAKNGKPKLMAAVAAPVEEPEAEEAESEEEVEEEVKAPVKATKSSVPPAVQKAIAKGKEKAAAAKVTSTSIFD